MDKLSGYILSVIAAAMILGIVNGFLDQKNASAVLIRLIGGLFLTFTIVAPAANFNFSGITDFWEDFTLEGEAAAAYGENLARKELQAIIKSETEAYILDKAKDLQAVLTAEVTLSEAETVPVSVRLQGNISPYGKLRLQQILEDDLGITKENQIWIG